MSFDQDLERALRAPLYNAMKAAGAPYVQPSGARVGEPSVQWPNEVFDPAIVDRYVRFQMFASKPLPREIGPTPAMTTKGFITVDAFVRLGNGRDQANAFIDLVRQAYPYALTLTRNGLQVVLDVTEVKTGAESGSWWQTNINVYWDVWR